VRHEGGITLITTKDQMVRTNSQQIGAGGTKVKRARLARALFKVN
jgi:hypothetical protein